MKQEHNFKSTFLCGKINFNKEVEKHADADPGKRRKVLWGVQGHTPWPPRKCHPWVFESS